MSTKTTCDACNKEVGTQYRRLEIGSHIGMTDNLNYHPCGTPTKGFDLCGRCLNAVETAAYEEIQALRGAERIKAQPDTVAVPVLTLVEAYYAIERHGFTNPFLKDRLRALLDDLEVPS